MTTLFPVFNPMPRQERSLDRLWSGLCCAWRQKLCDKKIPKNGAGWPFSPLNPFSLKPQMHQKVTGLQDVWTVSLWFIFWWLVILHITRVKLGQRYWYFWVFSNSWQICRQCRKMWFSVGHHSLALFHFSGWMSEFVQQTGLDKESKKGSLHSRREGKTSVNVEKHVIVFWWERKQELHNEHNAIRNLVRVLTLFQYRQI